MKQLLLLLPLTLLPVPVQAQQVNYFGVCTQNKEVYRPGEYDQYGNYSPGEVSIQSFNVPCNQIYNGSYYYRGYNGYNRGYYRYNRGYYCSPTRTLLGGVLGGSIGRAMTSTRNNRYNRGWATALGASIGGLAFSC